jgi:hypothetical protein
VSNAREQLALRNTLHQALGYTDLRDIYWPAVLTAATPAIERGWTGDELARWCIADLGDDVDNPGALIVSTIRDLAKTDPPRDITPQPTHITAIHEANAAAIKASAHVDHAAWVAKIKAQR